MSTKQNTSTYGSIPKSEEGIPQAQQQSDFFDSDSTYYLKDDRKWTYQKMVSTAIPLIGAVLIIGGAVVFLLRDFNHLYPGRGGSGDSGPSSSSNDNTLRTLPLPVVSPIAQQQPKPVPVLVLPVLRAPAPVKRSKLDSPTSLTSSCLLHAKCDGLIGECCPTEDGIFLDCCS
jgi:hypothetical protein